MSFRIRAAEPSDVRSLLTLVRAHNIEAQNGEATLNARRFQAAMFGKNAFVYGDLAAADDDAAEGASGGLVGYALTHDCFTTDDGTRGLYLTDLFVARPWRRAGVGRALMAAVGRRAVRRGATHVWWASMARNYEARRFYDRFDASDERVHAHAVFGDALKAMGEG
ncbi:MAG: GNAT family N-acetyltransferase [Parvularculaceae bacterium]